METQENSIGSDTYSEKRYLYVCEGQTDEDKLKKLGCLFVIATGGKFIRPEITAFLKKVHQVREIVLITDPDGPGKDIRERVERYVGPCLNLNAKKKECKDEKKGKVGIAEMDMEDLKELLWPCIGHDIRVDEVFPFDEDDYYDFGLYNDKKKRMKLVNRYSIPFTSNKRVEDCLLMLNVSKEEIQEVLEHDD